jgi:RNA polymerase sigma-70 factor (ECF subfamily)
VVSTENPTRFESQFRRCAEDLRQGGVAALGELYDLAAHRLLRFAAAITGSELDAEDALQWAFVRIARQPGRLAVAEFPWRYFLRVVRNEAATILRRRGPVPRGESIPESEWHDPRLVEERETADRVRSAVGRLPAPQAEVVALKIWEEMTFAEIADVLGESPNTVASRYRYALEKLSHLLQPLQVEVGHE